MKLQRTGRVAAAVAVVVVVAGLTACAPEAYGQTSEAKLPTMAPEQTVSEACIASGSTVGKLLTEAESSISSGIAHAGQDLLANKLPSFSFLPLSLSDTLSQVREQVTNTEVTAAIDEALTAVTELREIPAPTSISNAAAAIASVKQQLVNLTAAGTALQQLCGKN